MVVDVKVGTPEVEAAVVSSQICKYSFGTLY